MRYRINLFVLFLICSYPFSAVAQTGNRDGYIITLEKDTIYGRIENNTISKNFTECRFSDDKGTSVYTPSQIEGYGFKEDMFFTSGVVANTFLQVLISGELSLYKSNSDFYLKKKGNEVVKLKSDEITDTIEGNIYVRKDLAWKGYVNILIFDCIKDVDVLSKLTLDERSLTKLAIKYNICKGATYIDYLAKKPWTKVEMGIRAGVTQSKANMIKEASSYTYLPENFVSYEPSFGIVFTLSSPRFLKRIAFQSEIEFIKSDFFAELITSSASASFYHDIYIDLTTLSFPQSVRITVIDRNYRLFVNMGVLFSKNLSWETKRETEFLSGSDVFTSSGKAFEIENNQFGLWGGIGCQMSFDKFNTGVALKYNKMNNFCAEGFKSSLSQLSLSLIISTK